MIKLVFAEIVEALGGRTLEAAPFLDVRGVSTDSRTAGAGDLFFALRGPNFDGHDFVADALGKGAAAAVIAHEEAARVAARMRETQAAGTLVRVDDPLLALLRLADFHRKQVALDVIVVVGSNGKTTTKAMIDHVLQGRLRGRCSPKSFNNEIGVPLTLLSAEAADDYLVVEIGTNAPGEVSDLAALVQPDLAVITSLGEEHLEKLGDLHGVAVEECSVLQHLQAGGFAAVNVDWPRTREYLPDLGYTLVTFGRDADADLRVSGATYADGWLSFRINDAFGYRLRMPGVHNASNAAGAAAVARRLGFEHEEIAARLESFAALPMRGAVRELGGVRLINDAYNANPASMRAAIEMLEGERCEGRRVIVLGEMAELGKQSDAMHRAVAEALRTSKIEHAVLVGSAGERMGPVLRERGLFGPEVTTCGSVGECAEVLGSLAGAGDVVLLKASRAVGLDGVVPLLEARWSSESVA